MLYPECLINSYCLSIGRIGKGVRHRTNNGPVALNARVQATTMKGPRHEQSPARKSELRIVSHFDPRPRPRHVLRQLNRLRRRTACPASQFRTAMWKIECAGHLICIFYTFMLVYPNHVNNKTEDKYHKKRSNSRQRHWLSRGSDFNINKEN